MDRFVSFVNRISPLSQNAIDDLLKVVHTKSFKKGSLLASEARVCQQFYFLEEGLVKYYMINDEQKEVILRFFSEGAMFTALESFLTQQPAGQSIEALEQVTVSYISKNDLETLCKQHHSLERYYRLLLSQASVNMIQRISELLSDNATLRYHNFLAQHGDIAQRIQLGDLANYLGITQVTLSRIRAQK